MSWYAAHIAFSDAPFDVTYSGTQGEVEVIVLVEADSHTVLDRADALAKACDGMTVRHHSGEPVVVRKPWVRKVMPCVDREGQHVERISDGVIASVTFHAVVIATEKSNVDLDGLILVEG